MKYNTEMTHVCMEIELKMPSGSSLVTLAIPLKVCILIGDTLGSKLAFPFTFCNIKVQLNYNC